MPRIVSCLVALVSSGSLFAQSAVWDDSRLAEISPSMKKFIDEGKIAGAVTLIADKNRVVRVNVVGMADIEAQRPMQRDTIFRIASMTKPVTALALVRLVSEGKPGWKIR